jgi:site-specific recombinase XerD
MVKDGRTDRNPLTHLSGMKAMVDVRRQRRSLPPDEFALFLEAARTGKPKRKVNGEDRAVLYLLAASSGFRCSELASLTPESFDLASDFHSLRHQYVSNLAAAGAHPKIAQSLARHSTIPLTLDRYTHVGLYDLAASVNSLPAVPVVVPGSETNVLKATGTDDFGGTGGAHRGAVGCRKRCRSARIGHATDRARLHRVEGRIERK